MREHCTPAIKYSVAELDMYTVKNTLAFESSGSLHSTTGIWHLSLFSEAFDGLGFSTLQITSQPQLGICGRQLGVTSSLCSSSNSCFSLAQLSDMGTRRSRGCAAVTEVMPRLASRCTITMQLLNI